MSRRSRRPPRATNVVAPLATFVGRDEVLDAISAHFERGDRLVTLVGPPGMGKTRTAVRFAESRAAAFLAEGGVWFCDLTEALDSNALCAAVAHSLRVRLPSEPDADAAIEFIGDELAHRGAILIVLDNFEQLPRSAAACVARWCGVAPDACVLVTSRERLAIPGESAFELPPLAIDASMELFRERASASGGAADTQGAWTDEELTSLVRALDGVPLAIELAAARSRVLGPRDLLDRLPRSLDVLAQAGAGRHATLRAAIDGSWSALTPWERSALAQCSVFAGEFTLEDAEHVIDVSAHQGAPTVLDVLAALTDKSLLRAHTREGVRRFGMYVSIREYATERCAALGETDGAVTRHRRHFLDAIEPISESFTRTGDAAERARLAEARENLLSIHRRLRALEAPLDADTSRDLARVMLYLEPTLATESPYAELVANLSAAIDGARRAGDARLEGRLLLKRGDAHGVRGESRACIADMDAAIACARACGDRALEAEALMLAGARHRQRGQFDEALRAGELAAIAASQADCPRVRGENFAVMGLLLGELGRSEESRRYNLEARARLRAIDNRWSEALALANLAQLDQAEGAFESAAAGYDLALEAFRAAGDRRYEGRYLGYRAGLDLERGRLDAARETYAAALERITSLRLRHHEGLFRACVGVLEATAGRVAEAAYELDLADAILAGMEAPTFVCAARVHRGHLELAWARDAGDAERAKQLTEAARARLASAAPLMDRSEDVRYAARLLSRALDEGTRAARAPEAGATRLEVDAEGAWFSVDESRRVDLGRRGSLRRILSALARHHEKHRGGRLSSDALLQLGWPGEKVLASAGATRVRVALSTLRRLGLAKLLVTRDDGYLLDPKAKVDVVTDV